MKKRVLSLLFITPCLFLGASPQKISQQCGREVVDTERSSLEKGYHMQGIHLVRTIWSFIEQHKWDRVEKLMAKDYTSYNVLGQTGTRADEIQFLKGLNIGRISLSFRKVTQPSNDVLIVNYLSFFTSAALPDTYTPVVRMSVFQKIHGKWLWKHEGDLGVFQINNHS